MGVLRIVFSNFTWVDAAIILLAAVNGFVFAMARKEINRLYSGLLSAREVPQTVIDYTEQSVESHKSCIAFLESQLRGANA